MNEPLDIHALAAQPIGDRSWQEAGASDSITAPIKSEFRTAAAEAAKRASKKWLPAGKRSTSGPEEAARRQAFYERPGRSCPPASVLRAADRSRGCCRGRWREAGRA